jgi:phospholipid/cholesterol/gamma-HCH transport system substrate-binding protein
MRTLEPANRRRTGLIAIVVALLVIGVGQSFTSAPVLFAQPAYYAEFTDTGGLNKNDKVRITGIDAGTVEAVMIEGDHIVMKFTTDSNTIGTESRLAIRTDTILGKKVLEIEPRGNQTLRPGATLPLAQSTTPYQIYDAFFDVTKAATGWNIDTVKQSLKVLSQTINQTSPHLSAALDGVAKFSDTIGKRDDQIKHLLSQAHQVADILGDRGEQIDKLLVHANTLLAAINERRQAISLLLQRINSFAAQVQKLINDNPTLNRVLEQLRTISDILVKHKDDLMSVLSALGKFSASLSEAAGSGPFQNGMLVNLVPYWMLQPFVDAAFKKRGLDPQEFWRSTGLPAFKFPDPNGKRLPNGAPPPAPPVLEGTPDHPGPAVPPGSPCAYAPPPALLPRPGNPLPCAGVDQSQGPFGPLAGAFPAPVDVQPLPPNPIGLPPTPGIPIAGRPGQPVPDLPGTPVPLPPNAPPGARTEPVGPPAPPGPQLPAATTLPDTSGDAHQ